MVAEGVGKGEERVGGTEEGDEKILVVVSEEDGLREGVNGILVAGEGGAGKEEVRGVEVGNRASNLLCNSTIRPRSSKC
jgi:hypothetical protein